MSAVPVHTHAHAHSTPALADQPHSTPPLRVEIVALTSNDSLLEQIGQALDGESTIRQADSLDEAREFIQPLRSCVLLLEARGHPDIAAVIEELQSPDGTCIVVVFAPAGEIADVSTALKGSPTFAILPIPVEQAQTMAVLEGAREEALARLTLIAQSAAAATVASRESTAPAATPMLSPPRSTHSSDNEFPASRPSAGAIAGSAGGRNRRPWAALILGGLAIVAIVAGWFGPRAPDSPNRVPSAGAPAGPITETDSPPSTVDAIGAVVAPAGSSDELLEKAHAAMGARHYTDPEGDNALTYFRAVLAQDPANEEAKEGLQRIGVLLDERLQLELGQRKFNDVVSTLAQLRLIGRGGSRAGAGRRQVDGGANCGRRRCGEPGTRQPIVAAGLAAQHAVRASRNAMAGRDRSAAGRGAGATAVEARLGAHPGRKARARTGRRQRKRLSR